MIWFAWRLYSVTRYFFSREEGIGSSSLDPPFDGTHSMYNEIFFSGAYSNNTKPHVVMWSPQNPTFSEKAVSFSMLMCSCLVMIGSILSPIPFLGSGRPLGLVIGGLLCGLCTIPALINVSRRVLKSRRPRKSPNRFRTRPEYFPPPAS